MAAQKERQLSTKQTSKMKPPREGQLGAGRGWGWGGTREMSRDWVRILAKGDAGDGRLRALGRPSNDYPLNSSPLRRHGPRRVQAGHLLLEAGRRWANRGIEAGGRRRRWTHVWMTSVVDSCKASPSAVAVAKHMLGRGSAATEPLFGLCAPPFPAHAHAHTHSLAHVAV